MPEFDPSSIQLGQAPMNPWEPASSLPGVRGTGGHMPTQYDTMQRMLQQKTANELTAYILANDKRALTATGLISKGMGGKNSGDFMQSDAGKLTNMGISAMMNSGMLFDAGGNNLDMAFGIQNAFGAGVRTDHAGGASNQMVAGKGFVNDLMTKELYKSVQNDFYNPAGAANLGRTHGFDRGQIGGAFTALGQGGAFAGMHVGKLRATTEADYADALSDAKTNDEKKEILAKVGKTNTFDLDEGTSKKMKDLASRALKTVRVLADITGEKDVGKLMEETKRITGVSVTSMAGAEQARSRMERLVTLADNTGQNSQVLMSRVAQRGGGPMAIEAEVGAATAFAARQERRRNLADQGIYMPEFSNEQIGNLNQVGMQKIAQESTAVSGAIYTMQNTPAAKGHETAIKAKISAITEAKTFEAKREATADLNKYAVENNLAGGSSFSGVVRNVGAENVQRSIDANPESSQFQADFTRAEDMSRLRNVNIKQIVEQTNIAKTNHLDKKDFSAVATDVFGTLESDTQEKLIEATKTRSKSQVEEIMANAIGFGDGEKGEKARKEATTRLTSLMDQGPISDALSQARNEIGNQGITANQTSDGDDLRQQRRDMRKTLDSTKFGDGVAEGNMMDNFFRGMMGGTNLGEAEVLQYMENTNSKDMLSMTFSETDDGYVGNISKKEAEKLTSVKGLAEKLGVANTGEDIQKAMKSEDKAYDAMYFMKSKGYEMAMGTDGKLRMTDRDTFTKEQKVVQEKLDTKVMSTLFSVSEEEVKKATATKGRGDLGDLMDKHSDGVTEAVMDPKSDKGKAFAEFTKNDPGHVATLLDKEMKKYEKGYNNYQKNGMIGNAVDFMRDGFGFGDKNDAKKYEALKKEKDKAEQKGQEGDMIGRVKMIIDDGVIAELYKGRGLG